jgi:hypothetical protein
LRVLRLRQHVGILRQKFLVASKASRGMPSRVSLSNS